MGEPKIVYADNLILVLDKPAGWVVNRAESAKGPIVQDWVSDNLKFEIRNLKLDRETDFFKRSGIVHRLDKDTSGLLLVAKMPDAFEYLTGQFAQRQVKKRYTALVHGRTDTEGVVEAPVGRLPWNRERFGVFPGGRDARTEYRVVGYYEMGGALPAGGQEKWDRFSLLEVIPMTGRTHQIRVHLKSIGHPIVADQFYAGRKTAREDLKWCPRLFLHAGYLGFLHPVSGKWVEFTSALPGDLVNALKSVKM
jgi:23S rRNA pseudouridine1911/1915/1917 synthase